MLEDLPEKFGKLKMPEGSLIKKLERIKKIKDMVNTKAEQIKSNTEAIKNIEAQFSMIDQIVSSGKKGTDEFKERLDKIDDTVLELLSLYEGVSCIVNPFVRDEDNPISQKLSEIERKVENTIVEMKKTLESKAIDENVLAEKVTGLVVERIKPQARHRPGYAEPSPQYIEDDESGIRLPYLDNRPETSIILLNWIEFLMEKVGRNNLFDVLEYYTEIGWIGEEVSAKMMAYANGIDYYVERPTWKLLPEDHTKSLLFIEQLRGRKVDKNLFSRLERDVDKIIHSELLTQ